MNRDRLALFGALGVTPIGGLGFGFRGPVVGLLGVTGKTQAVIEETIEEFRAGVRARDRIANENRKILQLLVMIMGVLDE